MKFEGALTRYVGQDVVVYPVASGGGVSSTFSCIINEIGEGWFRATLDDGTECIVNTDNVIKVREYPKNKNGKKKLIID